MRWQGRRQSDNIEDRRSAGAEFGRIRRRAAYSAAARQSRTGCGRYRGRGRFYGIDLTGLVTGDPVNIGQTTSQQRPAQNSAQEQKQAEFTGVMLAETEAVWGQKFAQMNRQYREPKLVLYGAQHRPVAVQGRL